MIIILFFILIPLQKHLSKKNDGLWMLLPFCCLVFALLGIYGITSEIILGLKTREIYENGILVATIGPNTNNMFLSTFYIILYFIYLNIPTVVLYRLGRVRTPKPLKLP